MTEIGLNARVKKVKAHQDKTRIQKETMAEKQMREINEGADKLAVEAANEHQVNIGERNIIKERRDMGVETQSFLLRVMILRGEVRDEWNKENT